MGCSGCEIPGAAIRGEPWAVWRRHPLIVLSARSMAAMSGVILRRRYGRQDDGQPCRKLTDSNPIARGERHQSTFQAGQVLFVDPTDHNHAVGEIPHAQIDQFGKAGAVIHQHIVDRPSFRPAIRHPPILQIFADRIGENLKQWALFLALRGCDAVHQTFHGIARQGYRRFAGGKHEQAPFRLPGLELVIAKRQIIKVHFPRQIGSRQHIDLFGLLSIRPE